MISTCTLFFMVSMTQHFRFVLSHYMNVLLILLRFNSCCQHKVSSESESVVQLKSIRRYHLDSENRTSYNQMCIKIIKKTRRKNIDIKNFCKYISVQGVVMSFYISTILYYIDVILSLYRDI